MSYYVFKSTCTLPAAYQVMVPQDPTTLDIVVIFGGSLDAEMQAAYFAANNNSVLSNGMVKFVREAADNISLSSYRFFTSEAARSAFVSEFESANTLYFAEYPETQGTYVTDEYTITDEEYAEIQGNVNLETFLYEGP